MINYYLITKPGIIFGNLVTVAAGFLLASQGHLNIWLFLATLLGIAFIIGSACVFNNYIDREVDRNMERTKQRPIATGLIPIRNALFFATLLGVIGGAILFAFTNLLTALVAAIGFFVYVILYSLWKRHTIYSTAIGSVAGAVPPVIGYTAVSGQMDAGAWILFAMMILWQMPHFFSVAIYHLQDYTAAQIPVLPVIKGLFRTKVHMVLYIIGFIAAAILLTLYDYTGYHYLAITTLLGMIWLVLCLQGFRTNDNHRWACQMFRLSLIMVMAFCLAIPFDLRIHP